MYVHMHTCCRVDALDHMAAPWRTCAYVYRQTHTCCRVDSTYCSRVWVVIVVVVVDVVVVHDVVVAVVLVALM